MRSPLTKLVMKTATMTANNIAGSDLSRSAFSSSGLHQFARTASLGNTGLTAAFPLFCVPMSISNANAEAYWHIARDSCVPVIRLDPLPFGRSRRKQKLQAVRRERSQSWESRSGDGHGLLHDGSAAASWIDRPCAEPTNAHGSEQG